MHISTPYSYLDNGLGRVQVKTFERGIGFLLPFNQFTGDEHCAEEFSHLKGFDILFSSFVIRPSQPYRMFSSMFCCSGLELMKSFWALRFLLELFCNRRFPNFEEDILDYLLKAYLTHE
jgi:hypothetical protein